MLSIRCLAWLLDLSFRLIHVYKMLQSVVFQTTYFLPNFLKLITRLPRIPLSFSFHWKYLAALSFKYKKKCLSYGQADSLEQLYLTQLFMRFISFAKSLISCWFFADDVLYARWYFFRITNYKCSIMIWWFAINNNRENR